MEAIELRRLPQPLGVEEQAAFERVMRRRADHMLGGGCVPADVISAAHEQRRRRRAQRLTLSDIGLDDLLRELFPIVGSASYVTVTLDTTAPAGVSISIDAGAVYATSQNVTATIATTDPDTTGYTMKVWGDVDNANDANVQTTEGASAWITYATSKAVKLSSGDGSKTLHLKVRDDVWNVSSEATDSITLDTTVPVVTVQSGPSPAKISKVATKDKTTIVWQSDSQYDAYKVKVVPATSSIHSAGTQVPTTGGSTNVSGSTANQPATTNVTTEIDGDDLETAGAEGDNYVKIFVQDDAGNWST